jgi:hypothetical protein
MNVVSMISISADVIRPHMQNKWSYIMWQGTTCHPTPSSTHRIWASHFPLCYRNSSSSWWKNNVVSNTVSLKKILFFSIIQFSQCDISILVYPCLLYSLVHNLRCWQWWGFIIWSGLGHHVVWYMGMNLLEEHSGPVFTGSREDGGSMSWLKPQHPPDYTVP